MSTKQCYAKNLENCSEKLTKEHYFTYGILRDFFPGIIKPLGLPFTQTTASNFFSRILCEKHNNQLKALDTEACKFFRLIRNISSFRKLSGKETIKGKYFERWLLKVYLGLYNAGHLSFKLDAKKHNFLVKLLFGEASWPQNSGMHASFPELNSKIEIDTSIGVHVIKPDYIVFGICNIIFILTLNKGNDVLAQLPPSLTHATLHPFGVKFRQTTTKSVQVKFNWPKSA